IMAVQKGNLDILIMILGNDKPHVSIAVAILMSTLGNNDVIVARWILSIMYNDLPKSIILMYILQTLDKKNRDFASLFYDFCILEDYKDELNDEIVGELITHAAIGGYPDIVDRLLDRDIIKDEVQYMKCAFDTYINYISFNHVELAKKMYERFKFDIRELLYDINDDVEKDVDYVSKTLAVIKYLTESSIKNIIYGDDVICFLAEHGRLDLLKTIYNYSKSVILDKTKIIIDDDIFNTIAESGYINVLKFLHENGHQIPKSSICAAAYEGQFEVVKWLYEVSGDVTEYLDDLKAACEETFNIYIYLWVINQ
ncbi:MAG: ankyrin repeat domain-containing protein, partial [Cetobacterium sp.]